MQALPPGVPYPVNMGKYYTAYPAPISFITYLDSIFKCQVRFSASAGLPSAACLWCSLRLRPPRPVQEACIPQVALRATELGGTRRACSAASGAPVIDGPASQGRMAHGTPSVHGMRDPGLQGEFALCAYATCVTIPKSNPPVAECGCYAFSGPNLGSGTAVLNQQV